LLLLFWVWGQGEEGTLTLTSPILFVLHKTLQFTQLKNKKDKHKKMFHHYDTSLQNNQMQVTGRVGEPHKHPL
jgi:hypothetical protein